MNTVAELEKKICLLEEKLKDTSQYYEHLIALMPGHIYWENNEGVILGCNDNQARSFGFSSRHDIIGKTAYDLLKKKEADFLAKINNKVMSTGKAVTSEESGTMARGVRRTYFSQKIPLKHHVNNEIIGILGISIDITDKKHAETLTKEKEIAEQTITRLKTIAGSIAHELKNPLAGIGNKLGLIQVMAKKLMAFYQKAVAAEIVESPQGKALSEKIKDCADAAYKRVEYAGDYIGMQLANMSLDNIDTSEFACYSISEVMQEALSAYSFDNDVQQALVHWQGGADFSFVGSQRLTVHVIWNLLSNALHYIIEENKGEITVWLESDAQYNYLHFKDTAKGMPAKMAAQVFDQFFSKRQHGTGLGLAFCQMVMQAYGGDITCTAEENKYAQFTLKFPQQK